MKGERLDQVLEQKGYFASRQLAQAAIMDGGVLVNGIKVTKPGTHIKDGARIEICKAWQLPKYLSRGGLKLEKALNVFNLNPQGRICIDVGASTGGFTDCLLKAGASYVYAVDVGHSQLHSSLRLDERVKVLEKCNARFLSPEVLGLKPDSFPDLAVIDVSFISISKILPALISCLAAEAQICALIKPQFEAGAKYLEKGGVVKSATVHKRVILDLIVFAGQLGLKAEAITYSPFKGPKGNIEFLLLWSCKSDLSGIQIPVGLGFGLDPAAQIGPEFGPHTGPHIGQAELESIVDEAHQTLSKESDQT